MAERTLSWTPEERQRLARACQALGTTFEEFIRFATLQALDEVEGLAREAEAIRLYCQGER